MFVLELTKQEKRALEVLLWCNPCLSGCAYEEMEKSKKDCNECVLSDSIQSLSDKLYAVGVKK